MFERHTNIMKLSQEASLSQEVQKTSTNPLCHQMFFFQVTHLFIIQKWLIPVILRM